MCALQWAIGNWTTPLFALSFRQGGLDSGCHLGELHDCPEQPTRWPCWHRWGVGDDSFESANRSEAGLQRNGHLHHVEFVERAKLPYLRQHPLDGTRDSRKDKRVLRAVQAGTFLNSGLSPCVTLLPCLCVAPWTFARLHGKGVWPFFSFSSSTSKLFSS